VRGFYTPSLREREDDGGICINLVGFGFWQRNGTCPGIGWDRCHPGINYRDNIVMSDSDLLQIIVSQNQHILSFLLCIIGALLFFAFLFGFKWFR
jgi:hypothetical protein